MVARECPCICGSVRKYDFIRGHRNLSGYFPMLAQCAGKDVKNSLIGDHLIMKIFVVFENSITNNSNLSSFKFSIELEKRNTFVNCLHPRAFSGTLNCSLNETLAELNWEPIYALLNKWKMTVIKIAKCVGKCGELRRRSTSHLTVKAGHHNVAYSTI